MVLKPPNPCVTPKPNYLLYPSWPEISSIQTFHPPAKLPRDNIAIRLSKMKLFAYKHFEIKNLHTIGGVAKGGPQGNDDILFPAG